MIGLIWIRWVTSCAHNRFDLVIGIGAQALFDLLRVGSRPPVAYDEFCLTQASRPFSSAMFFHKVAK
ncbi:hypothetical protein [Paracoccus mutanolyticus]|uniref:hypothetical protein n=1 Tax=Paracoccus mutanolyticus TaxID=1499308 RepID=UPI00167A66B0|nr:hypothetical protein [Paracoccus mutanolyticus]